MSPDGVYTYDVVAVDGAGNQSVHSAGTTVTVDITPPDVPTGLTAQAALTAQKPALSWSLASDNPGGSGIVRYDVYRGAVLAGSSTGTTFTDTGLSTNGSYAYTVKAVDAAGNVGAASAPYTVTWDSTPPPTPINLTALSPTSAAPVLSWQSGGAAADFDHYDVYRSSTLIWSGTATTYTDDQPAPPATSGNLSYTVKAVDALGNASTASVARTVVYDIAAPSAVASLTAASPTIHPALGWTTASDAGGSGLAGYRVYRDGVQVTQTTGTTFIDSSLSGDGTYAYTVRAIDNAGNLGAPSPTRTVQVDQTPPPAPSGLFAQSPTNHVTLSWPATSDTGGSGSGVAQYRVYRNGSPIAIVSATAYTDTSLAIEGTWQYTVSAIDATGNEGPQSAPISVLYDATPPPAPVGLAVAAISTTQPSLSWISGGPDALSGFDHYELLRDGAIVASTTSTSIVDVTLTQNGSHTYAVRAVDAAGNRSNATPTQSAIFDNTPPAVPASVSVASPSNRPVDLVVRLGRRRRIRRRHVLDLPRRQLDARRDDCGHDLHRHDGPRRRAARLHGRGDRRGRQLERAVARGCGHGRRDAAERRRRAHRGLADAAACPLVAGSQRPLGHRALRRVPGSDVDRIVPHDELHGLGARDRRQLHVHGRCRRRSREPRARIGAHDGRLRPHAASGPVDPAGVDPDRRAAEPGLGERRRRRAIGLRPLRRLSRRGRRGDADLAGLRGLPISRRSVPTCT